MKRLLAGLLCSSFALLGCGNGGVPGVCRLDFTRPVVANFGDGDLDALLEATARLHMAATDLDSEVRAACNGIATDLGAPLATDTEIACNRAVEQIERVKAENDGATLVVDYTPGVCSASGSALVACVGRCDASFDATATPPTCVGGMLSGSCSGACCGSCTIEGTVECTGSCAGSCAGTCSGQVRGACTGTCTGQCDGVCAATAADGSCAGACDGACNGVCAGTVTGSCSGTCGGTCQGSCRYPDDLMVLCPGVCSGSCDVGYTAPRCEGGHWDVTASAECKAACQADVSFDLVCTEPVLVASFSGAATSSADLVALLATLEANLPKLLAAGAKAGVVVSATNEFATHLEGATSAATSAGLEASSCLVLAIQAQLEALATVNVTVTASVNISASASATAR